MSAKEYQRTKEAAVAGRGRDMMEMLRHPEMITQSASKLFDLFLTSKLVQGGRGRIM